MTPHKLLLLPICLAVISCSSDAGNNAPLPVVDDSSTAGGTFRVALKGDEVVSDEPIQLVYRLRGNDPFLTDNSSTVVLERVIALESLPATVELEWPENAESYIRPPVSEPGNARFSIHFNVDLDLDGQICNGDLEQDYSRTDYFAVASMPVETIEFHLKTIDNKNEYCEGY